MLSRLLNKTPRAPSAPVRAAATTARSRREGGHPVQAPEPIAPRVGFDFSKISIFPKLVVGEANARHEQESGPVASQLGAPAPATGSGGRVLQANPSAQGTACAAPVPPGAERALAAHPAEPLPESLRVEAEQRFGLPLDDIRVHQGAEASRFARAAGARAFTLGRELVFGSGQYDPRSEAGRALLWHELGHVAQGQADQALRAPLYDTTRWTITSPVTGQTLANMKTAIAGKISKGDIASATVVGVPLGTDEEMYLLNIIYQLGTKGNWDRVMKVEAEVAPPVRGVGQLGLVTVTIDAAGAVTAELIQKGPLVEPLPYSKDDAIKKVIADFGVAGFEKGDKEWAASDVADINDVAEALALIPAGDRAALKGVTFTRWSKLTDDDTGKELAGQFRSKGTHIPKGATSVTVDQRAELRLADSAFNFGARFVGTAGKTLPASYQTILHEVGHAVEKQATGKAADALDAAVLKQNTTFQAAETARKKWKEAYAKGQDVTPFKAAFNTNIAANKAATAAAAKARTALAGTQVAASTIKTLETDATTKRTAAKTALATADAAVKGWSPGEVSASEAYRLTVTAVDTALDTYVKDTAPGSGTSAHKADVALLAAVTARDKAREDLKKSAAANPAPGVYAAVETAQAAATDAARTLAHSRGRTLRLQKFKDLVDNNKITPFTQYARDNWPYNPEEFYAEAYSLWLSDPTFVQKSYQPIYDFFNSGEYAK